MNDQEHVTLTGQSRAKAHNTVPTGREDTSIPRRTDVHLHETHSIVHIARSMLPIR